MVYFRCWLEWGNRGASHLHRGDGRGAGKSHNLSEGYCKQAIWDETIGWTGEGNRYIVFGVFWSWAGHQGGNNCPE